MAKRDAKTRNFDDRWFATYYSALARTGAFRAMMDPWRASLAGQARGEVVEIGAGGGQNFGAYDPAITTRVTAVEPNGHLRRRAEAAARTAHVPITLVDAPAEALPFPDASFDTALATFVFCSVDDPARGLAEIWRVVRPGGRLLLLEHVRSQGRGWGTAQDWLTPAQRVVAGNCHLNRRTGELARAAGFAVEREEWSGGGVHPMIALVAARP